MHWKDLEVWKKAHSLVPEIYKLTARFPKDEKYGIIDQLRRAAYSVPANISVEKVRYFLLLSTDLGYINKDIRQKVESEYENASKMLNGLIKSLKG